MSAINGWPTSDKLGDKQSAIDSVQNVYATVQPTGSKRMSIDTVARYAFRVGSTDAAESGSTTTMVVATSHVARQGDFLRFETANANQYLEVPVIRVTANNIYLGGALPVAPSAGNTFYVMRYATQRVDDSGSQIVTVEQGPITFELDGTPTEVSEDTGTPANSIPLPVKVLDADGLVLDFAKEITLQQIAIDANSIDANTANTYAELQTLNATDFATETTLATVKTDTATIAGDTTSIDGKLNSLGQKAMAGSVPVVIASDQSTVPVSAASLPLPAGAATEATLASLAAEDFATETTLAALNAKVTTVDTDDVTITSPLPAGTNNIGDVDVLSLPSLPAGTNNIGDVDIASSVAPNVPAAVTAKQAAITVGTSAVRMTTDGSAPSATRRRLEIMVDPTSTANFWYGSSSVTSTSGTRGVPVFPGQTKEFINDPNDWYIISDTAAQTVFVVEAE